MLNLKKKLIHIPLIHKHMILLYIYLYYVFIVHIYVYNIIVETRLAICIIYFLHSHIATFKFQIISFVHAMYLCFVFNDELYIYA